MFEIKGYINKIKGYLVPDGGVDDESKLQEPHAPKQSQQEQKPKKKGKNQRLLDAIQEQFDTEMEEESYSERLLYHTYFTVFVPEEYFKQFSSIFALMARDSVNVFNKRLREAVNNYPKRVPHSKYWVFQLVSIPAEGGLKGITADDLEQSPFIVRSQLFPDDEPASSASKGPAHSHRIVATLHTKDSVGQIKDAVDLRALAGLTMLDKNKYRIEFDMYNDLTDEYEPKSEAEKQAEKPAESKTGTASSAYAQLHIHGGNFILGGQKFHAYNMETEKLVVSGKNGSGAKDSDELCIDDEAVPNPTLEITRNKQNGSFSVKAQADVKVNEKTVTYGNSIALPDNSQIHIDYGNGYFIDFKVK